MKTILLQQYANPENIPKIDLAYVPVMNRRQPPGIGSNARKALKYYVLAKKKESPKILELEDSKKGQELQSDYKKVIKSKKRKKPEQPKSKTLQKEVEIALSGQGQSQTLPKKRQKKNIDKKQRANKSSNMETFLLN